MFTKSEGVLKSPTLLLINSLTILAGVKVISWILTTRESVTEEFELVLEESDEP